MLSSLLTIIVDQMKFLIQNVIRAEPSFLKFIVFQAEDVQIEQSNALSPPLNDRPRAKMAVSKRPEAGQRGRMTVPELLDGTEKEELANFPSLSSVVIKDTIKVEPCSNGN